MRYDYTDYKDTWKAMEKLVEKGLVKAIGLSNFNSRQIDDVLSVATVKPAVLQVRWRKERMNTFPICPLEWRICKSVLRVCHKGCSLSSTGKNMASSAARAHRGGLSREINLLGRRRILHVLWPFMPA